MFRTRIGAAFLAASVCALAAGACSDDDDDGPAGPQQETMTATLTGAAERPTPVTTTATGTGTVSFTGNGAISYTVNVSGLSGPAISAHIHGPADASVAGNIIVTLTPLATVTTGQLVSATFSTTGVATVSMDSLKVLLRNGRAYFNVHTTANPNGEIRGQIID